MTDNNLARLLDGVTRYAYVYNNENCEWELTTLRDDGQYVRYDDILAALEAAPVPDLADPVTVHANMLRGTIAKPTVAQIIHLYGREAFQPMIDAAVAKALDDACLAVSEHADWPEDEHGRTEQVGLFARVINAIRAIAPAQVDETPKSEHDSADVLTAAPVPGEYTLAPHLQKIVEDAKTVPQWDTEKDRLTVPAQPDLVEAGKVLERLDVLSDMTSKRAGDTIRALIALATAQAAQIAGLEDKLAFVQRREIASNTEFDEVWSEAQAEAATLRAEVERLRGALRALMASPALNSADQYARYADVLDEARAALEGKT